MSLTEALERRQLLATTFYPTAFADRANPTIYEQYIVELINRARAAPSAEALRQAAFPSKMASNSPWNALSEVPPTTPAVQPLAINAKLQTSAKNHTIHLLKPETTGITYPNWENNVGDGTAQARMQAAGYPNVTVQFPYWGEGVSWTNTGVDSSPTVDKRLGAEQLYVEQFTNLWKANREDRKQDMLKSTLQEIGVSIGSGMFQTPTAGEQAAYVATVDYASQSQAFVTGAVFDDTEVSDDFYQPGEGQKDVQITVHNVNNSELVYGTRTWAAGGFSIPLPNGEYVIRADARWGTMFYKFTIAEGKNTKVDFIKGNQDDAATGDVNPNNFPAADDSKWFRALDNGGGTPNPGGPGGQPTPPPVTPETGYVSIIDRTLVIQGTAFNDKISVTLVDDLVYVNGPRSLTSYAKSAFDVIAIKGLDGNDRIEVGRNLRHTYIEGGYGDDTIITSNGNDLIYGNAGRDLLVGGTGNDRIVGGKHTDRIFGQDGNDTLYGQDGNDFVDCGNGRDHAFGGNHDDSIFGSGGNDCIYGGDGVDTLVGGNQRDLTLWKQGDSRISVEVLLREEDLLS